MTGSCLVIGVGNPDCGDDGLGPAAAARLAERAPPGVKIIQRAGDGLALIEDWDGCDTAVLIDAAAPAGQPGRIHRFDLTQEDLPAACSRASTHAFGLNEAVRLARALGRLPARVIVYAVEGLNFAPGAPLTPQAAAAVPDLVARLAVELLEAANP